MTFRLLLAAVAATMLAGCAVPVGQIRNGRFVSAEHGQLRVRNQTIAFDLRELPAGVRVKKRVLYRLQPDQTIELNLRLPAEYRTGVGAYLWRLEDGAIVATDRREPSWRAAFYRPGVRRPVEVRPLGELEFPALDSPQSIPEVPSASSSSPD